MRILITDDEEIIRNGSAKVIANCLPNASLTLCANATEAIAEAEKRSFDIAFLDIEMPGMNGIDLAKQIKKLSPETNIIFSTAYPQYANDAFTVHASGYVTKPLNKDKVLNELEDLRHPVEDDDRGLRVQAFGNFEVFFDGKPLHFKYAKTKELFAYLIDRNCALVDIGEIRATLWDDDEDRTSYLKQLRKDLLDTLKGVGAESVIASMRGSIGVIPTMMKCDFFEYLAGTAEGINAYRGEYMQQYSWSELTHGNLESKK